MKYRKKPVVIEAIQITGEFQNFDAICEWAGVDFSADTDYAVCKKARGDMVAKVYIDTLEGQMTAKVGDYLIKGIQGEFYPCKPDIFEKTYYTEDEYAALGK